jgi:hypothetical protein
MDARHTLWMIWGAIIVSLAIVAAAASIMILIVTRSTPFDDFQRQMIGVYVGSVVTSGITAVIGFWLGSSFGSLLKNNLLKSPPGTDERGG